MVRIKVLTDGYVKEGNGTEMASSSVTLIQENNLSIIVDPGMDKALLLDCLENEGLSADKISYVILTHTHLDHCLLAGIFENAKILDNDSIYSLEGKITPHDGRVPGTNIEIIKTPGHDPFHCSIAVEAEGYGKVVVAGDVLWWMSEEPQETASADLIRRNDPYAKDERQLEESRKKILEIADYVIPGHGKIFKVGKLV